MSFPWGRVALFVGGALFGSAGFSILGSKDAKKVYTHVTAAALRGRDAVMERADVLRENCEDIVADAQDINEERYEAEKAQEIEWAKSILAAHEEECCCCEEAAPEPEPEPAPVPKKAAAKKAPKKAAAAE